MRRTVLLLAPMAVAMLLTGGVILIAVVNSAQAAFPGTNGRIAFVSSRTTGEGVYNPTGDPEVFTMNPDGTGVTQVTHDTVHAERPAYSSDSNKIAYQVYDGNDSEIFTISADGGSPSQLTDNSTDDAFPAWSLDGTKIAYTGWDGSDWEIFKIDATGGTPANVTNNAGTTGVDEFFPAWSPDGTKIAYQGGYNGDYELFTISSSGGTPLPLTNNTTDDHEPAYSPDGTKIVYWSPGGIVSVIASNGGAPTPIAQDAYYPDWGVGPPDATPPDTNINSGPQGPTNDPTPTFTFSGSDDATASADLLFSHKVDGGDWSAYLNTTSATLGGDPGLRDGPHTFYVRAKDQAGNVDPSPAERSFTVDTAAAETTLTQSPDTFSDEVSPNFSFISNEANSTFECKLDQGSYQPCTSPKRYTLLSEGQHTFAVRATDAAGNADQTPAEYTWTVDSLRPKVTFTERPGYATGPDEWDEWITNDRSPTWVWTVEDPNLDPDQVHCYLYDYTNRRYILNNVPCSSPYTFEAQLPDGDYSFEVEARDKADNYGYADNDFEVDTVAPKFVSGEPTGKRVSRNAWPKVTFDDDVYDSARFVNSYKRGSNTPLPLDWRDEYGQVVELNPKGLLKPGTWYTVEVTTEVNDGANNLEAPQTWSFKTKG